MEKMVVIIAETIEEAKRDLANMELMMARGISAGCGGDTLEKAETAKAMMLGAMGWELEEPEITVEVELEETSKDGYKVDFYDVYGDIEKTEYYKTYKEAIKAAETYIVELYVEDPAEYSLGYSTAKEDIEHLLKTLHDMHHVENMVTIDSIYFE